MIAIFTIFVLAGCGDDTYDQAMKQGKQALASGDLNKAIGFYESALDENPKDKAAKRAYETVEALLEVEQAIKKENWDEAMTKANKLLKDKSLPDSIKSNLKESIKTAKTGNERKQAILERVETIKTLIKDENYAEAQKLISGLKQEPALASFLEEVNKLELAVNEGLKQQQKGTNEEKTTAAVTTQVQAKEEQKKDQTNWVTYHNERFGYTVKYPKGWVLGPEPTNGDGRSLYHDNDTEITVFASYFMEETNPDLSSYEKLTTHSGKDAYLSINKEGSMIDFNGVVMDGTIIFQLGGYMSEEFYKKNAAILKEMLVDVTLY